MFDVRWKGPVLQIPSQSIHPVSSLAFQPPKWSIDAAEKRDFPVYKKQPIKPGIDKKENVEPSSSEALKSSALQKKELVADMFSPVQTKSKLFSKS